MNTTEERNINRKAARKLKKEAGLCAWMYCTEKTDKRLFGAKYSYCADHRKYFKEYQRGK